MPYKTKYVLLLIALGALTIFSPAGSEWAPFYFFFPPFWALLFVPSLLLYALGAAPTILAPKHHQFLGWSLSAMLLCSMAFGPNLAGRWMVDRALSKLIGSQVSTVLEQSPSHVALIGMDPYLNCAQICRLLLTERDVSLVTVKRSAHDDARSQTYMLAQGSVCLDPRAANCITHEETLVPIDLTVTLEKRNPDSSTDPGMRPGYLVDIDALTIARSSGIVVATSYGASARTATRPGITIKNITSKPGFNPVPHFLTEMNRLRELDIAETLIATGLFSVGDKDKLNINTGAYEIAGPGSSSLRRLPPDAVADQDIAALLASNVEQFDHPAHNRIREWITLSENRTNWQSHDIALVVALIQDARVPNSIIWKFGKPMANDTPLRDALMTPILAGLSDPERNQSFSSLLHSAARAGMQPADLAMYADEFSEIYLAATSHDVLDPLIPIFGLNAAPELSEPEAASQPGTAGPPTELMGRKLTRSDCVPDLGYCRHIYLAPGADMPSNSPVAVTITPTE